MRRYLPVIAAIAVLSLIFYACSGGRDSEPTAAPTADETTEVVANEATDSGDANSDTAEGEASEGEAEDEAADGDTTEGEAAEDDTTEGDTTEGEAAEDDTTEGDTTEGEAAEDDTTEGDTTEGEAAEDDTTEGDTTEGETTPVVWAIDADNSEILFSVTSALSETVSGEFTEFTGEIKIEDGDRLFAKVALDIATESIDTADPDQGEYLQSADFLDADDFPAIKFVSSKYVPTDATSGALTGVLIIRDVAREVTFDVALNDEGSGTATVTGNVGADLAEWGLAWEQSDDAAADDEMTIDMEIALVAEEG